MRCQPLLSPEDADLAKLTWHVHTGGYARSNFREGILRRRVVRYAHRIILARMLGRTLTPDEICDHKNRNRLDCRRENLRVFTRRQNNQNRCVRRDSRSGIRGVKFNKRNRKWVARVVQVIGGVAKEYTAGHHDTKEAAGRAAAELRKKLGFVGEE